MNVQICNSGDKKYWLQQTMALSKHDKEEIARAKAIIDADISRHLLIGDIAQQVAMGVTKLKIVFREMYGQGLYHYLRTERMKKAMELIVETNKTIKEIARVTGFKHYNNFISAFTKHHCISPGKARKNSS